MVNRLLKLSTRNSLLLFGARGTGKSTLIHKHFDQKKNLLWIDLLQPEQQEELGRSPGRLRELIQAAKAKLVVIDEIQKIPALLDVVQELIEEKGIRFILTGSSARKLKAGAANLLAARAFSYHLDPLTHLELASQFDLQRALEFGLLPKIYFPDRHKPRFQWNADEMTLYLQTYARTYLKEEIQLEQIVRRVEPFRNFLEVAAQMNGKIIEYATIARDVGVDDKTVAEYFSILEDTLIGFYLRPYHGSVRKRQGQKPKFYLFDPGVKRALDRTLTVPLLSQTFAYGEAFEHFLILEFHKIAQTINPDIRFSFLNAGTDASEVDLIVEHPGKPPVLVEIKSSKRIKEETVQKLTRYSADFPKSELFILCQEPRARVQNGVRIVPWQKGLKEILKLK